MAQSTSSFKVVAILFAVTVVAILSATASAQDFAPAPAPSADTGSAFSLPISGAIVCSSVVLSLLAFVKF